MAGKVRVVVVSTAVHWMVVLYAGSKADSNTFEGQTWYDDKLVAERAARRLRKKLGLPEDASPDA